MERRVFTRYVRHGTCDIHDIHDIHGLDGFSR
jgi:hypothetical protein